MTFLPTALFFVILLLVPIGVYAMAHNVFPDFVNNPQIRPLIVLGGSVYYLSIYSFFYGLFIDYYLDIWVVTNDRIIDTEQHGLFHRSTTELELFRIQDVTARVKGVFATFFKYGDLTVKTASGTQTIVFHQIPQPQKIREELIKLAREDRKYHPNE